MPMHPAMLMFMYTAVSAKTTCSVGGPKGSCSSTPTSLLQGRTAKIQSNANNTNVVEELIGSGKANSTEFQQQQQQQQQQHVDTKKGCGFSWGDKCNDGSGSWLAACIWRNYWDTGQEPGCNEGLECRSGRHHAGHAKCAKPLKSLALGESCKYDDECGSDDCVRLNPFGGPSICKTRLPPLRLASSGVVRQRDTAMEKVQSGRAAKDDYFEKNEKLQQNNEALEASLLDASNKANRSATDERLLHDEIQQVKADAAREQKTSHAASASNDHKLAILREDLRAQSALREGVQADLSKTQSVLTDKQRPIK